MNDETARSGNGVRRVAVPVEGPFAWSALHAWLAVRALPGVESVADGSYTTALSLAGGPAVVTMMYTTTSDDARSGNAGPDEHERSTAAESVPENRSTSVPAGEANGVATVEPASAAVVVEMRLTDPSDEAEALDVVRRILDLDAPVAAIDAHLREVPIVGDLVEHAPGMRIPGEATPLLALVRALAGQQVSVAGGLAQMYRLVETCRRERRDIPDGDRGADRRCSTRASSAPQGITPAGPPAEAPPFTSSSPGSLSEAVPLAPFPAAETILAAGLDWYRGPSARRETIRRAVELAADGGLDPALGTDVIARELLALKGIGPWTVAYTLMRGYGDPDVDLSGDRALVNAAKALGDVPLPAILDAARPYRSYAALHLWRGVGA